MKKVFGSACLVILFSWGLFAQSSQTKTSAGNPNTETQTPKIRVRVDLVNMVFTVRDKKHRLVTDLTRKDFRVFEDHRPQKVRFFSRETNLPLRIGIMIDTSNSIRPRLHFEQEAAIDFLDSVLRPGKDKAFVVGFDIEPQVVQDFTDNTDKLASAIRMLQAGGGTALYDALFNVCKDKMILTPPPQPYIRRVIILISDGMDNLSQHTREEALAMAQRGEVTIFGISTNRSGLTDRGDRVLKYLSEETGGQAYFPFQASDLAVDFKKIARTLRSQYSLAYVSTNSAHDGTFRTVTIKPLEKGLHVEAKAGYFAPAQ